MPTRILIVRTSSLGDLVHMLPAISDIARHVPDAEIDWVAEEAFAEIPAWHPAVNEVIKVAHRRWRKAWWSGQVRAERKALRERLRAKKYDIVLDMQALLKSAWLVRQARGVRHGLDWRSAREPLASLFYNVRHKVEFWQPAVIRQRKLAALTFGYQYAGQPDFGLQSFSRPGGGAGWRYGPRCPERGAQRIRDAQAAPSGPGQGLCRGHAVRQPGRQALARGRLARGVPPPARRRLHPEAAGRQ